MEVVPGIHRIEGRFAGRYLFQHVLVGERAILLVDSGIASTPDELIFPYLREVGRDPAQISYVVSTHPDTDHFGGNAALLEAAPSCRILAHELDVTWLEDPDRMVAERYDAFRVDHQIGDSEESLRASRALCGDPARVDVALSGGESIRVGDDWRVEIVHAPGHSAGHLAVWDARSRALLIADAAMGRALPFVDGTPALAPTYTHPTAYIETAGRLRSLGAEHLLTAHFPLLSGDDVGRFLDETVDQARRTEAVLLELVARSPRPLSLRELIDEADRELGPLPSEAIDTWAAPFVGHLEELVAAGRLIAQRDASGRTVWSCPDGMPDAS